MDEGDREWQDQPAPADGDVDDPAGGANDDEPPRDVGPDGDSEPQGKDRKRSEQDEWRRWAWIALIIVTVGVGWALVLGTILVVRSGDRTAELISLFEEGQQQRQAALGNVPQSQEERQAALKTPAAAVADVPGARTGCSGGSGEGQR